MTAILSAKVLAAISAGPRDVDLGYQSGIHAKPESAQEFATRIAILVAEEGAQAHARVADRLGVAEAILRMLIEAASADKVEDFSRTSNVADMAARFLRGVAIKGPHND